MTTNDLNERFALAGVLLFEDDGPLVRARVTLPAAEAIIYLQGAHLAHWQPAGFEPVLFLSEKSQFVPGKAIRGGIPICFPWFGPRSDGGPGPSHGFARTQPWELAFAALMPDAREGDRLQMTFVLGPDPVSEGLGFYDFRVAYELLIGRDLTLKLTVANFGDGPLRFEEALHTYFRVGEIHQATITGLANTTYLDKRDNAERKTTPRRPLQLVDWTDCVFPANTAATNLNDVKNGRLIRNEKRNSATTVVWNPWQEGAAALSDLGSDEWHHFLAIETANTGTDAITLAPGQTHTMQARIAVERP